MVEHQLLMAGGWRRPSTVTLVSLGVVALASLVLLGWGFHLPLLTSVLPGLPPMRPITALTFLLAGGSLWLRCGPPDGWRTGLATLAAGGVLLLALLILADYLLILLLGREVGLLSHVLSTLGATLSGRMSPHSAVSFLLAGAALWRLDDTHESAIRQVQLLAAASCFIAVLALLGYTYQATLFYGLSSQTGLSLPTALGLMLLTAGILACHSDRGWMALVSREGAGGLLLRRLLPAAIGLPLLLGWLRMLGQHAGWYDTAFGIALMVAANILLLTGLLWRQAQALQALDDARAQAEATLQRTNQGLEQRVQERTAELSQAREYWRQVVSSLGEAVIVTDGAGTLTFLNPAAETLTGWTASTARGRSLAQILPVGIDPAKQAMETPLDLLLQRLLVQGERFSDLEIQVPDRQQPDAFRHWRVSGSPARLQEGTVAGAVIILSDITAYRQIEAALRLSEEQFRTLFEQSSVAMTLAAPATGRLLRVNTAFATLLGYPQAELVGRSFLDFTHPDDRYANQEAFSRLERGESATSQGETRLLRQDGASVPTQLTVNLVHNAAGQPIRTVVVIHDLTTLKQTEQTLFKTQQRLQALLQAVPVGIAFSEDSTCQRITGNPTLLAQFEGRPEDNLSASAPEGTARGRQVRYFHQGRELTATELPLQRALAEKRLISPLETEIELPNGRRWFAQVSAAPVLDRQGQVTGSVAVVVDITTHKRIEQVLQEADQQKDVFLATLAHELRNPLAPLRNGLHLLRLTGGLAPAAESIRAMLERQVNHLVHLVDDLLDISRITCGTLELHREPVDLAAIIHHAIEASQPRLEAAGHHLQVTLPSEPLYLDADPVRLTQVFTNVLNNAAKYTDAGGHIWLTAQPQGHQAVVSVRDTGAGIPADVLPHIFEPFTQATPTAGRINEGLGIGLALVHHLVQLHGGRVEAHSAGPGQGSEFIVYLPLVATSPADITPPQDPAAPLPSLPRLLVVDDNRDAADSLGFLLESLGADVQVVYDGPAALDALPVFKPTAVVLDLGMPGMDGYEVARRIRQQPDFQGIILIALTGWGREDDRRRTHQAGFTHHLVKPVDSTVLQTLLASVVRRPG